MLGSRGNFRDAAGLIPAKRGRRDIGNLLQAGRGHLALDGERRAAQNDVSEMPDHFVAHDPVDLRTPIAIDMGQRHIADLRDMGEHGIGRRAVAGEKSFDALGRQAALRCPFGNPGTARCVIDREAAPAADRQHLRAGLPAAS